MPVDAPAPQQPAEASRLDVGEADDGHEREADAAADAVMAAGPAESGPAEETAEPAPVAQVPPVRAPRQIRRKAVAGAPAHQFRDGNDEIAARLAGRVADLGSGGAPLSASARAFFEPRFGRDLGDVRIHGGSDAASLAGDLGARAFTVGNHIAFGSGELNPDSAEGRRLLAHELAHVIQQTGARPRRPAPAGGRSRIAQAIGVARLAGDAAVAGAREAARAAAPVMLSAVGTSVQRLGLGDLNPLEWAKKALKALTGDADSGKAALRSEGAAKGAEIDGLAQTKGAEIDGDGRTRGSEIDGDGRTKGGEIDGQGKEKGTEIDAQGQERGGQIETDGQTRGGELEADGQTRGGEVDQQGRERGAQLEAEGREHAAQLEAESAERRAQVEADAEAKDAELEGDAQAKEQELQEQGRAKGEEVRGDAEARTQEVDADRTRQELADHAEQEAVEKAVTEGANTLRDEARGKSGEVESGWSNLHTEATGIVARLDAEAGALCSRFQGKAQEFVQNLDKGIRPVFNEIKQGFDTIQREAEAAWAAFMDRIGPVLQQIEQKWSQFTDWVGKNVWEPLKARASELARWAGDLASQAWEKAKQAWEALKQKAEAAFNWIKEKLLAAVEWLKGLGDRARAWIKGKADAARNWIRGKADAARNWIRGRAAAARNWIKGKATAARNWIKGKANAARGWIKGKATAARNWVKGKADGARSWIKGKADGARNWIKGKATAATSWIRDKGHGAVSAIESRVTGLVDSISSKGGPIMKWLGGAVNSLVSGVADVGHGAVDVVSGALGRGLQFVEDKATGAVTWVENKATGAVTWVENKATGAITWLEQRATGAVNFVEQKATGAVNFLERAATGAVSFVEQKATGAVNFLEQKATGAVNFLERTATGAVGLMERAASGAVTLLERAASGAVTLVEGAVKVALGGLALVGYGVYKLGEGAFNLVKAGWDKASEWLGQAYEWCKERISELGTWLNENVIQPAWQWLQEQWASFQQWFKDTFPGLVKCWEVFKEWAGTIGAYIGEQLTALLAWFNALPDWMQYLILGMIAPFSAFPLIAKLWNELPPGVREGLHLVLDVLGLIPGYGAIADLVNSLLYLAEGDFLNAAMGLLFAIPGLGDVAKGGDLLKDAGRLIKNLGPQALELLKKADPRQLLAAIRQGADELADFLRRLGGEGVARETGDEAA
ncbi:MAG TPA: DUF4157 domain-containing protein, partial [Myxococcota bacterium]|nr:DUF4157 domain-containing protein [Myxococcota bacterium]